MTEGKSGYQSDVGKTFVFFFPFFSPFLPKDCGISWRQTARTVRAPFRKDRKTLPVSGGHQRVARYHYANCKGLSLPPLNEKSQRLGGAEKQRAKNKEEEKDDCQHHIHPCTIFSQCSRRQTAANRQFCLLAFKEDMGAIDRLVNKHFLTTLEPGSPWIEGEINKQPNE